MALSVAVERYVLPLLSYRLWYKNKWSTKSTESGSWRPTITGSELGLTLEPGKRYTQTVEQSFHLSMAALDVKRDQDKEKESRVAVMIAQEGSEYIVCTLSPKVLFQQPLDLNFTTGEEVTFFLNGQGKVHLTGYQIDDEDDLDETEMDDTTFDEESSDEEAPDLVPEKGSKRKKAPKDNVAKKLKWLSPGDEDSDEDDDEDSSDMEIYEEEEDSDEEDETPAKSKKEQKKEKQKTGEKEKPSKPVTAQSPAVDAGGDTGEKKKKQKKKKKKKQDTESETNESTQQQQSQQNSEKAPSSGKTPKKQVLAGGTIMEELKVGEGAVAKKGKMAHVYYVGKLAKNNVQFDSCTGGKPFRFRLGASEVIQGWDSGVAGMKVGGKRRLTVPPQQGYGSQRQGPIPPNSTLVFEVELKNVT